MLEFFRDRLDAPPEVRPACNGHSYPTAISGSPSWTLTEGELVAPFLAERVLQQYRGTPYAADLAGPSARSPSG